MGFYSIWFLCHTGISFFSLSSFCYYRKLHRTFFWYTMLCYHFLIMRSAASFSVELLRKASSWSRSFMFNLQHQSSNVSSCWKLRKRQISRLSKHGMRCWATGFSVECHLSFEEVCWRSWARGLEFKSLNLKLVERFSIDKENSIVYEPFVFDCNSKNLKRRCIQPV